MRMVPTKLVAYGAVLLGTLSFVPAAHAAPDPVGFLCGMTAVTDPQVEGSMTGTVDGGPLVLSDDTNPATTYTGYVVCTVQTGTNDTHAEADAAVLAGNSGLGPTATAAGTVTYEVGPEENQYLCTSVVTNGGTLYYDSVNATWSTSNSVGCSLATSAQGPGGRPVAYPSGTITISRVPLLEDYHYTYSAFSPPWAVWGCSENGPSVTCTPPDAPRPARNRCGTLTVEVTNNSGGIVSGESGCATGARAWAHSTGPMTPGTGAAVSQGEFAWRCDVAHPFLSAFSVTCSVGNGTEATEDDGDSPLSIVFGKEFTGV